MSIAYFKKYKNDSLLYSHLSQFTILSHSIATQLLVNIVEIIKGLCLNFEKSINDRETRVFESAKEVKEYSKSEDNKIDKYTSLSNENWYFQASIAFDYLSDSIQKEDLTILEQKTIDYCLSLSCSFRQLDEKKQTLDVISAKALYNDALMPIYNELIELKKSVSKWQYLSKKNLVKSIKDFKKINKFLLSYILNNPIKISITTAVILQFLANYVDSFNGNELLILESLRRSNNNFQNYSIEELSTYIQSSSPNQLEKIHNNVKKIYHEKLYQYNENNEGDGYIVELFDNANHLGANIKLINEFTGEIKEFYLKATNGLSYINKHNEKNENVYVIDTEEISSVIDDISSNITLNMSIVAVVSLAKNINILIKSRNIDKEEKEKLLRDAVVATEVAIIASMLLGFKSENNLQSYSIL